MVRDAALCCLAAALAWLAVEVARTLLRFEQEGFACLDDAYELPWSVVFDPVKESVAPTKRRVAVDADLCSGAAHRARIKQRGQIINPLALVSEPRQWRAGKVIEGATTLATTEPLQIIGLTMAVASFAGTVGAATQWSADLSNESDYTVEPGCWMEGGQQLQALRLVQRRQLREQLFELRRFHERSHGRL